MNGNPVEGALVCFDSLRSYSLVGHVTTDAEGRFQYPLPAGRYFASATSHGLTGSISDAFVHGELDHAEEGEELTGPLQLNLGGPGGSLQGQLELPKDAPKVALPLVTLWSMNDGSDYCAELGAEGSFAVQLPPSRYQLDVHSPGKHWVTDPSLLDIRANSRVRIEQPLFSRAQVQKEADDAVVAGLRQAAIPLATPQVGSGWSDLKPLDLVVKNARVVGLGEATHGTREFFHIKHRMLEYLVQEHGFDVFAIEAIFSESLAVNDYVLHGVGTAAQSLAGMYFWVWDTEEVLALIEWMRAYNSDPGHERKLRFYGVDMQFTPAAARELASYLRRVESPLADKHTTLWKSLADRDWHRAYRKATSSEATATRAALGEIAAAFGKHRDEWIAKTDKRAFVLARQHARILEQAESVYRPDDRAGFEARDRYMAENLMWLLENEPKDTKIVLWAHNAHISESPRGIRWMGTHLAEHLGQEFVTFAFTFNQGAFQARDATFPKPMGVTEVRVGPETSGTIGHTFARVGHPIFALHLPTALQNSSVAHWFSKPRLTRSLGSVYSGEDEVMQAVRIPEMWDAVFFVDKTTRARPTPTGRRGPGE